MPTKTKRNNSLYCKRYYDKNREKLRKKTREKYRKKVLVTHYTRLYTILSQIKEEPLDLLI